MIVPWRLIDGPAAADAFVAEIGACTLPPRLADVGVRRAGFAAPQFEGSGFRVCVG